MPPFIGGAHMISRVDLETSTWDEIPAKFEAGTSAIAEGVGLGEAVDYLGALGSGRIREHEKHLTPYALERLSEVECLHTFGPPDPEGRGGVVSFVIEG